MEREKHLLIETRSAIIFFKKRRVFFIRKPKFQKNLGVSPKGVHYTLEWHREIGSLLDKKRSGKSKTTFAAEDRFIATTSKRNRRLIAPDIAR